MQKRRGKSWENVTVQVDRILQGPQDSLSGTASLTPTLKSTWRHVRDSKDSVNTARYSVDSRLINARFVSYDQAPPPHINPHPKTPPKKSGKSLVTLAKFPVCAESAYYVTTRALCDNVVYITSLFIPGLAFPRVISVPNPKPTPARIAFSIARGEGGSGRYEWSHVCESTLSANLVLRHWLDPPNA